MCFFLLIRGAQFSHIYFTKEDGKSRWVLESLKNEDDGRRELATNGHPFGAREWPEAESGACRDARMLTLSACGLDEFTCSDGLCIPLK